MDTLQRWLNVNLCKRMVILVNESLKSFFERLMEDADFREEFASAKTAEEGYNKARPYIEGVSFGEFKEALTYVHNKIEYRKKLLKSDLSSISGGTNMFADVLSMLSTFEGQLF